MFKRMSRPGRWARALCWAGGLVLALGGTHVQAQAPPIELDLQSLLDSAGQGGQQRFQGSAWDIRPEQGRRVVLVPIRVTPGDEPYELSRPAISLRTARFIAWYVPPADANAGRAGGGRGANAGDTFRVGDSADIEELLLGERSGDDRGRDELADQLDAVDNATDGRAQSDVPYDAPRLARKLEIHPDGTVAWGMDRGFSGATPASPSQQNRYGYKLDPEAVQNEEPPRLERLTRNAGESSRDFAQRRREQAEQHRAALDEYRALREMIRELPDEFQEPLPEVVYAVFDAPQGEDLSFTGDNNLRWELTREKMDALAVLARPQGGAGQLNPQTADAALVINDMVGRGGELDARIAALAVYQGQLAQQVAQQNDAGYLLIRTLLANDDAQARNATLTSIARVQPPTRISAQLLAEAARNATGDDADALQLAALRSAFRIETGQGGNAGALLAQANDALAATAGPPAHRVLEELISAFDPAAHSAGRGVGSAGPDAAQVGMLVTRVDFAQIKPDQLDDVIAMVIRNAPHSPVAAGWLDQQLLRSADDVRTDRTLAMLGRADRTSTLVRPLTDELRALVFGTPDDATHADAQPAPVIDGVIALDSEQHGLVLALTSNDDNRRALAWEALRHFEVRDAGNTPGQAQPQGQTGRQVFDRIVDIGLDTDSQPDTPPSLVDFIDNPAEGALASHARVRMLELLLTEGLDPAVARRAARKVTGTGRDYSQPLATLDPAQRAAAVARVYELLTGEAPAVVALLQDPAQSQLTQWLAQQWQQGVLPTSAQWAQAAGDTDTLMRLAGSTNADVANAAAAAMVLQFGGTDEHQTDFRVALARLSDNAPDAIAAAWEPVKRDIFATRLSETEGAYRMVLTLYPQGHAQIPGLNPAGPGRPAPGRNPNGRAPSQLAEPALTPGRTGREETGRGPSGRDAPGRGAPLGPGSLPGPGAPGNPGNNDQPLTTIDLGIVQLSVNGDQVALSIETVPLKLAEDVLALQLEDVSTLTTFNNPDLADLPLSQLQESLNLLPVDDNTWTGHLQLPDGRVLEVSLKRE